MVLMPRHAYHADKEKEDKDDEKTGGRRLLESREVADELQRC